MTRPPDILRETARKGCTAFIVVGGLLACAGCSTPGPNHVYVAATGEAPILDLSPGVPAQEIPCFLFSFNAVYGIAYDPASDTLFLRVAPGNFIRVIDRRAVGVKNNFVAKGLPAGPGDLAIRSRDRHLFFAHPTQPVLVETTVRGEHVRDLPLEGLTTPAAGVAYDEQLDRLLILGGGDLSQVATYALDGKRLGAVALDRDVLLTSLAFDSIARELYVPLSGEPAIGVFNLQGRLVRTLPVPPARNRDHIDVGPRAMLRMF